MLPARASARAWSGSAAASAGEELTAAAGRCRLRVATLLQEAVRPLDAICGSGAGQQVSGEQQCGEYQEPASNAGR